MIIIIFYLQYSTTYLSLFSNLGQEGIIGRRKVKSSFPMTLIMVNFDRRSDDNLRCTWTSASHSSSSSSEIVCPFSPPHQPPLTSLPKNKIWSLINHTYSTHSTRLSYIPSFISDNKASQTTSPTPIYFQPQSSILTPYYTSSLEIWISKNSQHRTHQSYQQ